MESYLVSLLLMAFMMADVITVPMCFNGDICLLAVCLHHRSEGENYRKRRARVFISVFGAKPSGAFLFGYFRRGWPG